MKKLLAFLLTVTMLFSLAGCDYFEKEELFDVDEYLDEADALIEEGDLEGAEKLLQRALRKAEDEDDVEELEACLELVQSMMNEETQKETATVPTVVTPTTGATQQTTGVVAPEVPYGVNLLDSFNSDEMYRINVFLSNFSEQRFDVYPCSDYDLLMYGYSFAKVNNRDMLGSNSTDYYMNKADMDYILNRFFGRTVYLMDGTVLDERNYPVTYTNGAYYWPAADGASYSYCSVATNMVKNANGTYTVTFDIYEHIYPHESMSPYYSYTAAQAAASGDLVKYGSGTAVVRDHVRDGGIETYQLISYIVN